MRHHGNTRKQDADMRDWAAAAGRNIVTHTVKPLGRYRACSVDFVPV
jgi:hypothetical protein